VALAPLASDERGLRGGEAGSEAAPCANKNMTTKSREIVLDAKRSPPLLLWGGGAIRGALRALQQLSLTACVLCALRIAEFESDASVAAAASVPFGGAYRS
jgi:hypothetical protein